MFVNMFFSTCSSALLQFLNVKCIEIMYVWYINCTVPKISDYCPVQQPEKFVSERSYNFFICCLINNHIIIVLKVMKSNSVFLLIDLSDAVIGGIIIVAVLLMIVLGLFVVLIFLVYKNKGNNFL